MTKEMIASAEGRCPHCWGTGQTKRVITTYIVEVVCFQCGGTGKKEEQKGSAANAPN